MPLPPLFPPRRLIRWLLPVLALILAATASAGTNYLVHYWDFESGISVNGLNCLCLGRDGFLWLGAKDGLLRFDGVQFTRETFPESTLVQGNSITALWESEHGQLWLGCESGEVYCWDRRHGTVTPQPQKWPSQPIRSIATDGWGDVWIALATHDLVRIRDGWILNAPASAPTTGTVQHLLPYEGRLYQQFGSVLRLQGGTRESPVWQELRLPETTIQRIAPSHAGGLWVYANDRIRRWTGTQWGEDRGGLPPGTYINRMMESSSGDLFIGTLYLGMLVYRVDGTLQRLSDGAAGAERIVDVTEDRAGNILACSDRRLSRIRLNSVGIIPSDDNWGGSRPISVASNGDGTCWMGTEGSGLYHILPGRLEHFGESSGLSSPFVWSLLAEKNDQLWIGTWGGGLFLGTNNRFRPASNWDLSIHGWAVSALLRDHEGVLWAATNTGLWRLLNDRWVQVSEDDGSPVMLVRGLQEGRDGRIWLATNGHGLKFWAHGRVTSLGSRDGIPARFISSIHCDQEGGIWIGTRGMGLYWIHQNHYSHLDYLNGLPADDIFHIAEDQRGKFWFSSPSGVFAVTRLELEDAASGQLAQVHPLIIDRDDGLPSSYCSQGTQSAAYMSPEGKFWVPTALGLAVIPTDSITARSDRVPVTITSASIDDRIITPSPDHSIQAPAGTRRIAVEFTAPSFDNPERIHFRYQLLGLDNRWVDLGPRRNVLFSHLPPGDYTLRIMASNPDRVWNPSPASLVLSINPYFWETEWFRIGCLMLLVLLVGLTVWYIVHRRIRLRLEQLEAQQAIEQERRRIARDIHDELGASLTQIMMMSQAYASPAEGPDATLLPRIHSVACAITRSMDELVWAVNPTHDTIESFAAYGARITQELVSAAGLRLRLSIPNQLPEIRLSAGMRHHLLLFLKEAVNNVLRHARAREVSLTLAAADSHLRLEVSDDGQGFTPDIMPEAKDTKRQGGHGLPNLRRRAQEMGGVMEISSSPQRGTTLRLMVPLPLLDHP